MITRQQDSTTVTEAETQLTRAGTGGDWSGGVSQLLASLELIILIKSTTTTASSLHRQTVLRDMLRLSVLPQKHCLMSGGTKTTTISPSFNGPAQSQVFCVIGQTWSALTTADQRTEGLKAVSHQETGQNYVSGVVSVRL